MMMMMKMKMKMKMKMMMRTMCGEVVTSKMSIMSGLEIEF